MAKNEYFIGVQEVQDYFGVSKTKAYEIIRGLNAELKAKGKITIAGKVSRAYAEYKFGINIAEELAK